MSLEEQIRTCVLSVSEQLFTAWAEHPEGHSAVFVFEAMNIGNIVFESLDVGADKNVRAYVLDRLVGLMTSLHESGEGGPIGAYLHEAQLVAALIGLLKKHWRA